MHNDCEAQKVNYDKFIDNGIGLVITMKATGVKDLENYQAGKTHLTATVAIRAKCAECTAKYADGKFDCEMAKCPLYEWMPYKGLHDGR